MQPIRSLDDPDPVQQYLRRWRLIYCLIVVAVLVTAAVALWRFPS